MRARSALADLLAAHKDCAGPAGEILAALNEIERSMNSPPDSRLVGRDAGRRGRNKPKDYVIERRGGEEELAEYRRDDPRPFRAPKAVFESVVAVLAGAPSPLHAEEVEREVARRLKGSVPNYVVRLCLRWLTSDQVRLADRVRARYAAKEPKKIRQGAAAAWSALSRGR